MRNCILALAASKISLYSTSILHAYEESEKYQVWLGDEQCCCGININYAFQLQVSELLNSENMLDIAILTQQKIKMTEDL